MYFFPAGQQPMMYATASPPQVPIGASPCAVQSLPSGMPVGYPPQGAGGMVMMLAGPQSLPTPPGGPAGAMPTTAAMMPTMLGATAAGSVSAPSSPPSYEAVVLDPNGPRSQTNLFVRKLASAVTEKDMSHLFEPYGKIISFALMRDIHTGESLGTAFVRYETHDQARQAMAALDGLELYGRPISIQWAKRHHDGTPVGEARRKIHKVFVRNIPVGVNARDLRQLFSPYGAICNVTVHADTASIVGGAGEEPADEDASKTPQPQRNIAFVVFHEDGAAELAVRALHNTCPFTACEGIPLMVKLAEDNKQRLERKMKYGESVAAAAAAAVAVAGSGTPAGVQYLQPSSQSGGTTPGTPETNFLPGGMTAGATPSSAMINSAANGFAAGSATSLSPQGSAALTPPSLPVGSYVYATPSPPSAAGYYFSYGTPAVGGATKGASAPSPLDASHALSAAAASPYQPLFSCHPPYVAAGAAAGPQPQYFYAVDANGNAVGTPVMFAAPPAHASPFGGAVSSAAPPSPVQAPPLSSGLPPGGCAPLPMFTMSTPPNGSLGGSAAAAAQLSRAAALTSSPAALGLERGASVGAAATLDAASRSPARAGSLPDVRRDAPASRTTPAQPPVAAPSASGE